MSKDLNHKEIVNDFIFSHLMPVITSHSCPKILNLQSCIKEYLNSRLDDEILREELALKLMPDLIRRLNIRLEIWNRLGIPYPFRPKEDDEKCLITWQHQKYEELTGFQPVPQKYIEVMDWIDNLNSSEFLIACCVYLKVIGATKIFITDGSGDCGVDVIARVERSPFNSFVFFVQSKTVQNKTATLSRDLVLKEYGKYLSLKHEEIYQRYRRALGLDTSEDGVSYCYTILANCDFHNSAKEISAKIGALLRCKIQLSYFISQYFNATQLNEIKNNMKNNLKPDLTYNLADKIAIGPAI